MNKKLLIASLFLSTASIVSAQLTQADEPAIGNSITMYVCDSMAPNLINVTGTGVTWDYSDLLGYDSAEKIVGTVDPSSTSEASTFSSSTKAYAIEGFLTSYWSSTANDRSSQGFVFTEPTLGNVVADFNSNNELLMNYPFATGDVASDDFSGTFSFNFNGQQTANCTGVSEATIDGSGTLLLPNGVTANNVMRYRIIDTTTATLAFPPMTLEIVRTHFEYYDLSNNTLPIFTHTNIVIAQQGSSTPMADMTLVLSYEDPTSNVGVINQELNDFKLYPNPSEGKIVIQGAFDAAASISIMDQAGRVIFEKMNIASVEEIDLSKFEAGCYSVSVFNNGSYIHKQVVLK
jgi:hypothetical protein